MSCGELKNKDEISDNLDQSKVPSKNEKEQELDTINGTPMKSEHVFSKADRCCCTLISYDIWNSASNLHGRFMMVEAIGLLKRRWKILQGCVLHKLH